MKLYIIMAICAYLTSCSASVQKDADVVSINYDGLVESSMFVDTCYMVKLEQNDNVQLETQFSISKEGDRLFIYDDNRYIIHIYDDTGRYINTLSKRGKGHGEYIYISGYDVYEDNIFIFDNATKHIYIYDKDLNFKRKVRSHSDGYNIKVLDDNLLVLFADESSRDLYNFSVINYQTEQVVSRFDPIERDQSYTFAGYNAFNEVIDGNILITKHFDPTIYRYEEGGSISPLLRFDFNTKVKVPSNYRSIPRETLAEKCPATDVVRRIKYVTCKDSILYAIYTAPAINDDEYPAPYISMINLKTNYAETARLSSPWLFEPNGVAQDGELMTLLGYYNIEYIQNKHNIRDINLEGEDENELYYIIFTRLNY